MRLSLFVVLFALSGISPAFAQTVAATAPAPASSVANLEAVVVTGVQPGPGLWKVSKGDHVMWVLGTLSPLPDHMQWKTDDVEQIIAQSQEVLEPPSLQLKADVGFFGKLFLLPTLIGARKSPDGATLQQLVPPPLYARWLVQKQLYIGKDNSIERWRPIFAATELYDKAIKHAGLTASGGVKNTIRDLAKKHGVKLTKTNYKLAIANPREAVKTFKSSAMDDQACLSGVIDGIEHSLGSITARANAWATGDIEILRTLSLHDQREACIDAVTEAGFAKKLGLNDVRQRVDAIWMSAAEQVLANDKQSFAMLPMEEVLSPDGYLAKLKGKGYTVQAPDEQEP
ncbi:TraB/GumN family protein [Dyella tabacisoli]|uniref:TraB/GumN family protein n=1 Tax=Dyella tabacisoli TaxID=2282381 RepID=A0A369ULV9_9GAMM|nr:TraB/GumN family protein [Dyella tabacisoli]RDD80698.1 TraB/GumN family protein [Dyella tabacisoli]